MNGKVHNMEGRSGVGYKKHRHANSTTLLHAFFIIIIIITDNGMGGVCWGREGGRRPVLSVVFSTVKQLQHKREEGRQKDEGANTWTNL